MDTYQPIYDAVRSRLSNCDTGEAVERVMREANFAFYADQISQRWQIAAAEWDRPSVVYRPRIFMDGNAWCALYGENLQDGVAAFGKSPAAAMEAFDVAWTAEIPDAALRRVEG